MPYRIIWSTNSLLICTIALLFMTSPAFSLTKPIITRLTEPTVVHSSPKIDSPTTLLQKGMRVRQFPSDGTGNQKIEWIDPTTKTHRSGFLLQRGPRQKQSAFAFKKWGMGFGLMNSQLTWGAREVTITEEDVYDISDMTSSTIMPALAAQYFLSEDSFMMFSLIPRTTQFTGTASLQGSSLGDQKATLAHTMISFGTGYGFILNKMFFVSGFIEFSQASAVAATVNDGEKLPTDDLSLPVFIMLGAAGGMWWNIYDNWYLSPSLRIGNIVNTIPGILSVDVLASVGVRF